MNHSARRQMIIAMVMFGTIGLFVRQIPLESGKLALYRAVLAALLIGIYLIITKKGIPFVAIKKDLPLILLSGAAMGVNWIFFFQAYKYTTVSLATLSYYFAPVLVTIASPFLFREKLTWWEMICFALSTVGLILMTGLGQVDMAIQHFIGIAYGLGAAVLYATVILLNKTVKGVNGIIRTFWQFVAAIGVLTPYVLLTSGVNIGGLAPFSLVNLLVVGLVHTGVMYCVYFSAMEKLPGQEVSILSYLDPLVAVLVSVIFLNESMTWQQIVGGAMILIFTLANDLKPVHVTTEP